MTPCPACAEHLETIRALGETCDGRVIEWEGARAEGFAAGIEASAAKCDAVADELERINEWTRESQPKIAVEDIESEIDHYREAAEMIRKLAPTEMQRGGGARLHPQGGDGR